MVTLRQAAIGTFGLEFQDPDMATASIRHGVEV
jgi:hypothetical protein